MTDSAFNLRRYHGRNNGGRRDRHKTGRRRLGCDAAAIRTALPRMRLGCDKDHCATVMDMWQTRHKTGQHSDQTRQNNHASDMLRMPNATAPPRMRFGCEEKHCATEQTRQNNPASDARQTYTHKGFYTQKLLHTEAFTTHRCLYTQKLLHTDASTHRSF